MTLNSPPMGINKDSYIIIKIATKDKLQKAVHDRSTRLS